MPDIPEDRYPDSVTPSEIPTTVKAAGIIWIVIGGVILVNLLFFLLLMAGVASDSKGSGREVAVVGGACGGLLLGLFGAAFIYVGVQSVRGTARDTLGNGIGSILIGVLNFLSAIAQAGAGQVLPAIIGFLGGIGLIVAGTLALVGRSEYKAWRKVQKALRGQGRQQ